MNASSESGYNEKFSKNLFRSNDGKVRIIWLFIIIPIYLLSSIILSRVIFIIIAAQFYLMEGFVQNIALEIARTQMLTLEGQIILSAIDTLLMILLVFLLITKIEKRKFQWSTLGLSLKSSSVLYFILGSFLGFLFILITKLASVIRGTIQFQPLSLEAFFTQANVKFITLFFIWAMLNAFWQEIIFRGYLQTRVVERNNAPFGILTVSIYFVLIHFIDRELTLPWVISGTLLFILISLLFHHTKSLYLVGAMHGMINYLDQIHELLGFGWVSPSNIYWLDNVVILGIAIGIYILISTAISKAKVRSENELFIN